MRLVWTAPALADLTALRAYIARDKPPAADLQVQRILAAVSALQQFSQSGRRGRRDGTRELVVNRTPYIVPYRIRGDAIEILRVLHGRQRWPEIL